MNFTVVFENKELVSKYTYQKIKTICPDIIKQGNLDIDFKQLCNITHYCTINNIKHVIIVDQGDSHVKTYLDIIDIELISQENNEVKHNPSSEYVLTDKHKNTYIIDVTNICLNLSPIPTYDQLVHIPDKFRIHLDEILDIQNDYIVLNNGISLIMDTSQSTYEYDGVTQTFSNVDIDIGWDNFKLLVAYLGITDNGVKITISAWTGTDLYSHVWFNNINYSFGTYICSSDHQRYHLCFEEVATFILHPNL